MSPKIDQQAVPTPSCWSIFVFILCTDYIIYVIIVIIVVNPVDVQALAIPMSMAERWSTPSSVEGGYLLTDPLTGERLDTQQPPIWIRDDRMLAGGLAYLRRNASNLEVTVLYGRHGSAEDLGDLQTG